MALAERTKVCNECKQSKPESEYYRRRLRTGEWGLRFRCKDCDDRDRQRYRELEGKDSVLAKQRERYAKRMAVPGYREKMRELWRMNYMLRQERKTGMLPEVRVPVEDNTQKRLDAAPFRRWLQQMIANGFTYKEMAEYSGVPDTRLRAIVNQKQLGVTAEVVDKVLTAYDSHILLIYPDLYD